MTVHRTLVLCLRALIALVGLHCVLICARFQFNGCWLATDVGAAMRVQMSWRRTKVQAVHSLIFVGHLALAV
jgi:hypothetical protein